MERSVKTNLSRSHTVLFNGGVRFQSARAAGLVRVQLARAASFKLLPVYHASAVGREAAGHCGGWSPRCGNSDHAGVLDEIEALVFSRREREPSFYQGLF
jgi:hypothetical protein